ncbi:MAG: hypothetical protein KatS3mg117_1152 [Geminicoccaceae bacterium]|nr:MAG: hypothetical protein KatS3mg117_1152 [Geminicoccaceae bacterium]
MTGPARRDPRLVERVAVPLRAVEGGAARAAPAGPSDPPPRPVRAVPVEAQRKAGRRATPRRVELDRDALVARGFLDPLGGRSGLGEELRLVKRVLLERAFAAGAPARERIVAITSALPGEGKTFLAVNLALSTSLERDARVLLLDADPIKAAAVEALGVPRAPGLVELLGPDPADPAEVLVRTSLDRLWVLPPGAPEPRFTELLTSRRMKALLQAVLAADPGLVIVIDSPPLLASSEAQALAHLAGQTVLVVGALTTPRRSVDEAIALVAEHTEVQLLLNRAPGRAAEAYGAYLRSGEKRSGGKGGSGRLGTTAGAAAGWLALLAPPVALGNWQVVPRIELATAFTDNVRLEPDRRAKSDLVAAVGAGARLEGEQGAVRGRIDYQAKQFLFLETSSGNGLRHELEGTVRATLLPDRLHLDLAADVGDVFESGRELRPRSEFNDLDSRATRVAGTFSPFLTGQVGPLGEGTLRYRFTDITHFGDENLADVRAHTLLGLVSRPGGVERVGWTAAVAADRADVSRSFNAPARRVDTGLATLDLSLPLTPATALLVGAGWSYLSDETLGDGGGGSPYWRLGLERGLGPGARARATVGQLFGKVVADARVDLELAPRTMLRVGYEQGLRTRFDAVRSVLTDPERLAPDREAAADPDASERQRFLRALTPSAPIALEDRATEVKRGRLSLSLERERTLGRIEGYLQSSRPEVGGNSNLEGGIAVGFVRRLDRRQELELRFSYDRRRLDEDETTADDVEATALWRRRIGEGTRIELGYDFLHRFVPGDRDVTANTVFVRAVKEL